MRSEVTLPRSTTRSFGSRSCASTRDLIAKDKAPRYRCSCCTMTTKAPGIAITDSNSASVFHSLSMSEAAIV